MENPAMTPQEMIDALQCANTALADKLEAQPCVPLYLHLDGASWQINGCCGAKLDQWIKSARCDTPAGAFASMMQVISGMPAPNERHLREFQRRVAEVIDFGNAHGIEAAWLNPIVKTARALAENALSAPVTS